MTEERDVAAPPWRHSGQACARCGGEAYWLASHDHYEPDQWPAQPEREPDRELRIATCRDHYDAAMDTLMECCGSASGVLIKFGWVEYVRWHLVTLLPLYSYPVIDVSSPGTALAGRRLAVRWEWLLRLSTVRRWDERRWSA